MVNLILENSYFKIHSIVIFYDHKAIRKTPAELKIRPKRAGQGLIAFDLLPKPFCFAFE